jgi:hypothetical protein
MPVHQSCYGIESLPEGDWLCNNCEIFGFKRGLMVNCMLCPKRGGAMKPTNIFTSKELYNRYNTNHNSSGKKHQRQKHHHHHHHNSSNLILDRSNSDPNDGSNDPLQ